jgi:hypothetical protein
MIALWRRDLNLDRACGEFRPGYKEGLLESRAIQSDDEVCGARTTYHRFERAGQTSKCRKLAFA